MAGAFFVTTGNCFNMSKSWEMKQEFLFVLTTVPGVQYGSICCSFKFISISFGMYLGLTFIWTHVLTISPTAWEMTYSISAFSRQRLTLPLRRPFEISFRTGRSSGARLWFRISRMVTPWTFFGRDCDSTIGRYVYTYKKKYIYIYFL